MSSARAACIAGTLHHFPLPTTPTTAMKRTTPFIQPCCLLALAVWTSAFQTVPQVTPIQLIDLAPWTLTWPASIPNATPAEAVRGEFTGDRTPDVLQRTSTHLVLFMDPSYMDVEFEYPVVTSSIAVLRTATAGEKDRLLVADSSGLSLVTFDVESTSPVTTTSLGFGNWANAKSISCSDLNGDGIADVMGINALGTKLLRLTGDGMDGYFAEPDVSLGSGALEAFPMVYDIQPLPPPPAPQVQETQIAVLTQNWMFVMHQSGIRSRVFSTNGVPGHIAKVKQAPSYGLELPDCVAWLQASPGGGGNQQVALIDSRAQLQTPVLLGNLDVSAISSGDLNGDGSEDLCLLTRTSHQGWTLFNQRDMDHLTIDRFDSDHAWGCALSTASEAGSGNTSTPLIADLNSDRIADCFVIDSDAAGVPHVMAILTDAPTPPGGQSGYKMLSVDSGHPCFQRSDFYPTSYFCSGELPVGQGLLMLSIKDAWSLPTDTTGWTLDLVVYRQDSGLVIRNAIVHHVYALDGGLANFFRAYARPGGDWGFPILLPDAQIPPVNGPYFPQKYYIVVKAVPPGGGSATEYVTGFTSDELIVPNGGGAPQPSPTGPFAYLINLPGSWQVSIPHFLTEFSAGCPGQTREQEVSVGTVPLIRVPRYQQNGPPVPGNVVNFPPPILPSNPN
jgi:hypothetical protein